MYLSRLTLNPRSAVALRAMSDVYAMHRLLWRAFPDLTPRPETGEEDHPHPLLFRVETGGRDGLARVLAQSESRPNWNSLAAIPNLLCEALEQAYTPHIETGQCLRYRLRANPIASRRIEGRKRGARQGLLTEEEQAQWLRRQGEKHGFALPVWEDIKGNSHIDARIVSPGIVQGVKTWEGKEDGAQSRHVIRLLCVDYEGLMRVTDAVLFETALRHGLGPAKGLGFGLLSVARAAF